MRNPVHIHTLHHREILRARRQRIPHMGDSRIVHQNVNPVIARKNLPKRRIHRYRIPHIANLPIGLIPRRPQFRQRRLQRRRLQIQNLDRRPLRREAFRNRQTDARRPAGNHRCFGNKTENVAHGNGKWRFTD